MAGVNIMILNEVLCFIQHNFDKYAKDDILTVLNGFYTADEINNAKLKAFEAVEHLREHEAAEGRMPRLSTRKQSADKQRLDAQDILALLSFCDVRKLELPTFVASDLRRLPPFKPTDTDMCQLAANIHSLREEVASLAEIKTTVHELTKKLNLISAVDHVGSKANPIALQPQITRPTVTETTPESSQQNSLSNDKWARLLDTAGEGDWAIAKPKLKPKPKVIHGAKTATVIKSVPRPTVVFVGRLELSTSENDMIELLEEAGIQDPKVTRIKCKDPGRKFNTAAFRVSCDTSYQELLYDETIWPAGCELRDWIFYNK